MAKIIMKWTLICSDCEKNLALKTSSKLPESCPHCNKTFEKSDTIQNQDSEETFVPPVEKFLKKVNLLYRF